MPDFCSTKFWDSDLTWNSNSFPDFTLCFEETVLVWIPCSMLLVLSLIGLALHKNSQDNEKQLPCPIFLITKTVLNLVLAISSLAELIVRVNYISNGSHQIFITDLLTPVIKFCIFVYIIILHYYHRKYQVTSSGVLFIFWFLYSIGTALNYRTILTIVFDKSRKFEATIDEKIYAIKMITSPLVIVQLILSCFVDYESTKSLEYNPCPEKSTSFLSRMTFSWYNSLIWKGFKNPLTADDMWDLSTENQTSSVIKRLDYVLNPTFQRKRETSIRNAPTGETLKTDINVMVILLKTFWPQILFVSLIRLITTFLTFANPLVLDLLIRFMSPDNSEPQWRGFFYASLLLVGPFFESVLVGQYDYYNNLIIMKVRSCLITVIYRKSLKLSSSGRKAYTTGEITNLMAVDSQRLVDLFDIANYLWSYPLQIIIAMVLLWQQLGVSTLGGVAFMVFLMPLNGFVASKVKGLNEVVMKVKDKRMKLMNEILNGIKVFKLYAWETSFRDRVLKYRQQEVTQFNKIAYLEGIMMFTFTSASFFVGLFSFMTFVLISSDNILDANKAFVSLSLFNIIRYPLTAIPHLLSNCAMALVALKRINDLLNAGEVDETSVSHKEDRDTPVVMEEASFKWTQDSPTVLKNFSLKIKRKKLIAVVGQVGAGKSSLLSALLGELEKLNGTVNTSGRIAYVPQEAWIQNSTIRQNILFTSDYNEEFYTKVLHTCALEPDLKIFSAGDMTEIGEKGINLSGGQKQRVSLARAVYSDADIYLLDDPLSAVDAHVGRHLFDKVIGNEGLLKNKTRILVTHRASVLTNVDQIVVLKDGSISEFGSFEELIANKGDFAEFVAEYIQQSESEEVPEEELKIMEELKKQVIPAIKRTISVASDETQGTDTRRRNQRKSSIIKEGKTSEERKETDENKGQLIEKESSETGYVKWVVYKTYFKMIGFTLIAIVLLSNMLSNGATIVNGIWLSEWSADSLDPKKANDTALRDMRLGVYAGIGTFEALFVLVSNLLLSIACIRAANLLHTNMLNRILRAPISFFDTTPIGRILNRFSKDIDSADISLMFNVSIIIIESFRTVVSFVIMSLGTPIILVAVLPLILIYYFVQRIYISTSRQLKRIDSNSRSPIFNHFSESVNGSSSIRAFGVTQHFIDESSKRVDSNHKCFYPSFVAQRWLSLRLEFLGYCIVFFTALFAVFSRNTLSPGIAGLAISYSMNITAILGFLVRCITYLETDIVSVERIVEYTNTPSEAEWFDDINKPQLEWPQMGSIKFKNYSTRYRDGLDLVLKNISFDVKPNEKIGIVGRTGAGKSSLTLALFRLIEPVNGTVIIDGIDITKLGLYDLRSRLTVIPQDPALFTGTLRMNLDPFDSYTDFDIWKALESAHLKEFADSLPTGLNHQISEGGENLSVGQKQLVCLARALLKRSKILVLDEATAAVDMSTDDLIQETIRKEFNSSTIVTIAHRLNTIIDYDRVLVMDNGMISEFDSPNKLLADDNSIFYGLAKDANLVA